jgi:hypothetical protein
LTIRLSFAYNFYQESSQGNGIGQEGLHNENDHEDHRFHSSHDVGVKHLFSRSAGTPAPIGLHDLSAGLKGPRQVHVMQGDMSIQRRVLSSSW